MMTTTHVLLIEDDAETADMLSTSLGMHGIETIWARNAREAFQALSPVPSSTRSAGAKPDVIVLDLMLPEMDAVDLVKDLLLSGTELPPIIILSASSPLHLQVAADFMGARAIIRKPFRVERLLASIDEAVGESPHGPGA